MPLIECPICGSRDHKELLIAHGNRGVEWIPQEHRIVGCCGCGLTMINPQLPEEDYARYYEKYDLANITLPSELEMFESWYHVKEYIKFMSYALDLETGSGLTMLDVGSGLGALLRAAQNYAFSVTGLETSDKAIEFAQRHFHGEIIRGYLGDEDIETNRHWDIVSSTAVIEHVTNPVQFTRQLASLVVPSGFVYLLTPDSETPLLTKGLDSYFFFKHTFYFTRGSLLNTIRKAGLIPIALWRQPRTLQVESYMYPANAYMGILHVLAQRPTDWRSAQPDDFELLRESEDTVFRAMEIEWKRGRNMRLAYQFWYSIPARLRLMRDRLIPHPLSFTHHIRFNPNDCELF